jgi:hypothetical protein
MVERYAQTWVEDMVVQGVARLDRFVSTLQAGAETGRRHADLARIGLGKGDKLGNCLAGNERCTIMWGARVMLATSAISRMKLKLSFFV